MNTNTNTNTNQVTLRRYYYYVLMLGKGMTSARFNLWKVQCTPTGRNLKRRRNHDDDGGLYKRSVGMPPIVSIIKYEPGCIRKQCASSFLTLGCSYEEGVDAVIENRHVLIVYRELCLQKYARSRSRSRSRERSGNVSPNPSSRNSAAAAAAGAGGGSNSSSNGNAVTISRKLEEAVMELFKEEFISGRRIGDEKYDSSAIATATATATAIATCGNTRHLFSIRTDTWMCDEVERAANRLKGIDVVEDDNGHDRQIFDNVTAYFRDLLNPNFSDQNDKSIQGKALAICDNGMKDGNKGENAVNLTNEGSSVNTSRIRNSTYDCTDVVPANSLKLTKEALADLPKFPDFAFPKWLRKKKLYGEVKAEYYRYGDDGRSKEEARKAALDESVKAKVIVKEKIKKFLSNRNNSFQFAFEICAEKVLKMNEERVNHEREASPEDKKFNLGLASRLLELCSRDGALDELKRQENREGYNYNKENQKYRLLQYERAARVIRVYPRRINLSCIDLEYGNKNITSTDKLSLEKSIASKRLIENGTRLIRVGGSVYKRLIRAIILHEGSSGIYFRMLKDDPNHQIDDKLLRSKKATAILSFEKIWGVGIVSAVKIYRAGPSSISELRKNKDLVGRLNTQQQIGLNRYEDIMERIPRKEVIEIENYCKNLVAQLTNNAAMALACGSYRRGASFSGDVDILILPNEEVNADDDAGLNAMVPFLNECRKCGFLTDDLLTFDSNAESKSKTDCLTYMGICKLPGKGRLHRRIDIKAYPGVQVPFAILYFTGDSHFNRSIRAFAKNAGLTLTDAGLASCKREKVNGKIEKVKIDPSILCENEEEIFKILGFPFVPPNERICVGTEGRLHTTNINDIAQRITVEELMGEDSGDEEFE